MEIELLAAGLLERAVNNGGLEYVRVADAGINYLAGWAAGVEGVEPAGTVTTFGRRIKVTMEDVHA